MHPVYSLYNTMQVHTGEQHIKKQHNLSTQQELHINYHSSLHNGLQHSHYSHPPPRLPIDICLCQLPAI